MKYKRFFKITLSSLTVALTAMSLGFSSFSIVDIGVGETDLINNESTPYRVYMTSGSQNVATIPIGVGIRGDADNDGAVTLYDAIRIAKYLVNIKDSDYEDTLGYVMADTNINKQLDLYDAINVSKYLLTSGTNEERWNAILGES